MPVRLNQVASTCTALLISSGYTSAGCCPPCSQAPVGGPARPMPAGPLKPAEISPLAIMPASDFPSGAYTTFGGSFRLVTCSSSSTTQVTLDESSPYSLTKMPRVHTPVVTE